MQFLTVDTLRAAAGPDDYGVITQDDTDYSCLEVGETNAYAEVKRYLSHRWNVGAPLGDTVLARIMTDITLYYAYGAFEPRNIPEQWAIRYKQAMSDLAQLGRGVGTLSLPLINPEQGGRIAYGTRQDRYDPILRRANRLPPPNLHLL